MGACGVGQVARVPLLRRHRHDLATKLNGGPRPAGGDGRTSGIFAPLGKTRPGLHQIGNQTDRHPHTLALCRVKPVQVPRLLEQDTAPVHRDIQNRKIGKLGHLCHGLGGRIVDKQVVFTRPIRSENHLPPVPIRVQVIAATIRLGDLLHGVCGPVINPNAGMSAAPVILPLPRHIPVRAVGDLFAIGRYRSLPGVGDGELRRHAPGHRHGEQLLMPGGEHLAIGAK